ncbi:hypothetical protein BU17DRAFT_56934, partial [Hysterangium stoloniferum]
ILFCPTCENVLVIAADYNKWACNSCPYEFRSRSRSIFFPHYPVNSFISFLVQMTSQTRLKGKDVDDVLAGGRPGRMRIRRRVKQCDKCDADRAYYRQLQIRSADEPMTTCKF